MIRRFEIAIAVAFAMSTLLFMGCSRDLPTQESIPEKSHSARGHLVKLDNFVRPRVGGIRIANQRDQGDVNLPGITESNDGFMLGVFKRVVAEENRKSQKNVFVSPFSIAMALSMAYNGAGGTTRDAMQQTLGLQGKTLDDVNRSYLELADRLRTSDPNVKMQIANSIWYRQGYSVEQSFVDLNERYYDAVVTALDFSDPNSVGVINSWVNTSTNGKITGIIDEIPRDMFMYLINAVYFKGVWKTQFDKKNTKDDQFVLTDGSKKPCQMMELKKFEFSYLRQDAFVAADLPYGNGNFGMTILLPHYGIAVDSVISLLTEDSWHSWRENFVKFQEDFLMPKFKIEYEVMLNHVLTAMGMGIAFSDAADFTGISREFALAISEVKHKTFVAVDEDGTEAAAVTEIGLYPTSIEPPSFRVDRPFLFVIHEKQSGTILFMGKIVEPIWSEN